WDGVRAECSASCFGRTFKRVGRGAVSAARQPCREFSTRGGAGQTGGSPNGTGWVRAGCPCGSPLRGPPGGQALLSVGLIIWGLVAVVGLVLVAVGVIVRLCEGSWGKARGELGSTGYLIAGALLFLPAACYLAAGLLHW